MWVPANYALREAARADDTRSGRSSTSSRSWATTCRRSAATPTSTAAPRSWTSSASAPRCGSPGCPSTPTTTPRHPAAAPEAAASSRCPMDARFLGDELGRLHPQYTKAPANLIVTQADFRKISLGTAHRPRPDHDGQGRWSGGWSACSAARRCTRWATRSPSACARGCQGRRAGALRDRADRPVIEDGRVVGVRVRAGRRRARRPCPARRDPRQRRLREEPRDASEVPALPHLVDWTTGSQFNTGGGVLAGIAAGAHTDLLDDAWWGPTIPLPSGPWFCLAERNLPGSIIVNSAGASLHERGRCRTSRPCTRSTRARRPASRTCRRGW